MRYTTVLFDADGTLLDFSRSENEAVRRAMILSGIQPDDEKVAVYSKINDDLWKMLERGEIEKSYLLYHRFELFFQHYGYCADAKRMAKIYMEELSQRGYVLEGATELLSSLKGKVKMYIVTNGVDFIQRRRYAKSGIEGFFEDIFISGEIGAEKPDKKFFDFVNESLGGLDKERTLVVGDSLTSDVKGAVNYSLDSCWYNPKRKPASADIKPTYTAFDYDGVFRVICGEDRGEL